MSSRWFEFGGDTLIRTDRYIRLTSDQLSQSGWIFSRAPLTATDWEIEIEFAIHGAGSLHGDGFAMWLTKDRASPGPVFGHKDEFEGLGVFFDTYKNKRPGVVFPYVMAMMGDGRTKYDQTNDGKANEIGGCSVGIQIGQVLSSGALMAESWQARQLRGASIPTKAKVIYLQDQSLTLQLSYTVENEWITCFSVEPTDTQPLKLPNAVYLGFSAQTGDLSDNVDIVNVVSNRLYPASVSGGSPAARQESNMRKNTRKGKKASKEGWTWFLIKSIIVIGVVVGVYFGYTAYRTSKRSRF